MLLILRGFVGNIHTPAGIDRYFWGRQCFCVGDNQSSDAVVVDGQFLNPLTIDFFGLVNFNVVDQLIQHLGCQLFGMGVFADNGEKHICGNGFTAGLVQLFAERLDLFGKRGLFFLIALGHFGKASIRQFAGKIILIDPLKKSVQFIVSGPGGGKFLLLPLTLGFSRFLGAAHNRLQKFILIADGIFGKTLDFSKNNLFQKIYPDIVRGSTGSAISMIIRTVEILDIVVALVEVVIQVVPTVRANQKAAEDVPLRILRLALAHLSALFLNLFPDRTVNNGFVDILEHHPILPGVIDPLFCSCKAWNRS